MRARDSAGRQLPGSTDSKRRRSAIDIMFLPIVARRFPRNGPPASKGTIGERNASVYICPMNGPFTSIMRLSCSLVVSWVFLLAVHAPTHAQTVAVFDFELIDTSLEGEMRGARPDEQARLGQLSLQLRERLKDSGRFSLVDIAPVAAEARASNLQGCGGCDTRLAARVGADLSITGTVQKVSNLILNINIYIRDVSSGATIAAMSADMRGNTDESWFRALDWLIRNRLLAPDYGVRR